MSSEPDPFLIDERWRSDIVEAYFDLDSDRVVSAQRNNHTPPIQQNMMLAAPALEKTDSQWSPMSSGLVTPQDSIGYWSVTPDRRRSGRFSLDSSGVYGQSNRWSLGTQLSNVSFAECMAPADLSDLVPQPNSDEDKSLGDQIQDWSTVETSDSLFDEYDSIFHPDDEIILDPKESMEAPIKRASVGSRAPGQEWPLTEPIIPKSVPSTERFRRVQPLTLSNPPPQEQPLKIATCDLPDESYSARTSYSIYSDTSHKQFDQTILPKVTNRRSFIESPPEMFNSEVSWPLTGSTNTSYNSLWPHEKSLPPTPSRSRGVSLCQSRRGVSGEDYRMSGGYDTLRSMPMHNPGERPASWNPRVDSTDFDLNLDRAILGTSLARDHRLAMKREEQGIEEQQVMALESIFNTLKTSEPTSKRNSMNGYRERKVSYDDYHRTSMPPQIKEHITEAQRHRQAMTRIINERNLNPAQFDTSPKHARYFVIKSYNEDDVHKSLKFNIWASTEIGNRRLDKAYRESSRSGPIYLFFSVNASGQFCGMARMMSPVDYTTSSSVWTQTDKWKGRMDVRWVFVKDIPNSQLRHIRVWNNENKPVTNSRDTQELPPDAGLAMLRIFSDYPPKTSVILTNLVTAEMKADSDDSQRDDLGYNRQSIHSEDYRQETYSHRQSWTSTDREDRSQRSSQYDTQEYGRIPQIPLNRRNTISTVGPMGSTPRGISSTTPTSGMRPHDLTFVPPRHHENTTAYRTMLANVGETYQSHRYPPFHGHGHDNEVRYF